MASKQPKTVRMKDLARESGVALADIERLIQRVILEIRAGHEVALKNLGVFYPIDHPAKESPTFPGSDEFIVTPPRRGFGFRRSTTLKKLLREEPAALARRKAKR